MVTSSRLLRVALLGCAFVLSACSQTITSSAIIVSEGFLSGEEKKRLVDEVYQKAAELGGTCRLVNEKRQYHVCYMTVSSGSTHIGIGYSVKQHFMIVVDSTIVHGIPPADKKVVAGYYLPKLHKELEEWALTLIPPEAVVSADRSYIGYNASKELR